MPLQSGSDRSTFSHNVAEMIRNGHPRDQALAASYRMARRADGGILPDQSDPSSGVQYGAPLAPSVTTQGPGAQNLLSQFARMSPEQLQEYAVRAGNSPQGQYAQRVLQQKRIGSASTMQPAANAPQAPSGVLPTAQPGYARGGVLHRAPGGGLGMSLSTDVPWWTRSAARADGSGLLNSPLGASGGRSDTLPHSVAADTYVIPADVVSGLGEGDTYSGAKVLDAALRTGPWGTSLPRGGGHAMGPPRPPRPYEGRAKGGSTSGQMVPVLVANGEFLISPEQVAALGEGDVKKGHAVLDAFVKHVRRKTIKEMQKLPGPVK